MFLCHNYLPHISDHFLLYLKVDLELNILKLNDVVFYYYLSKKDVQRVSRLYLERTLRIMSYLIFFVTAILYMICRLVISFFSIFLFVLNFRV